MDPTAVSDVERITVLARTFPSIARHPAVTVWDPDALDDWACGNKRDGRATVITPAQRLAVQFILGVWDGFRKWNCGRFDVHAAVGMWDTQDWAAFVKWAEAPFAVGMVER